MRFASFVSGLCVLLALGTVGCTAEDAASDDLGFSVDGKSKPSLCGKDGDCQPDQLCIAGQCKKIATALDAATGVDAPGGSDAPASADPGSGPTDGTVIPFDFGSTGGPDVPTADILTADIETPTDPGTPPADPGPPPDEDAGPAPCKQPGTFTDCPVLQVCRIDPVTHAHVCSGSNYAFQMGSACTEHTDCDILYGCHFGACTKYCEVKFGASQCPIGSTCQSVGDPQWGACAGAGG